MTDYPTLDRILTARGTKFTFAHPDPDRLAPVLSKVPGITSREVIKFLTGIMPTKNNGPGIVTLLGLEGFLVENLNRLPGSVILSIGFIVFGIAGDGSSLAITSDDGQVLLLSVGVIQKKGIQNLRTEYPEYYPINREGILTAAERKWKDIDNFLIAWEKAFDGDDVW